MIFGCHIRKIIFALKPRYLLLVYGSVLSFLSCLTLRSESPRLCCFVYVAITAPFPYSHLDLVQHCAPSSSAINILPIATRRIS